MLNERQKNIILTLENTTTPLTARELADQYDVSLRTIRNDITVITEFVEKYHGHFIKKPHVGMKIDTPHSLSLYFDNQYKNANFLDLDEKERQFLLLMYFIMKDNPITIQQLQDVFFVSRSTIQTSIHRFNQEMAEYELSLNGYKKKGYYLLGNLNQIIWFVCSYAEKFGDRILSDTVFDFDNDLISMDWKEKIDTFVMYLTDHLFLFISNYYLLTVLFVITIRWSKRNSESSHNFVLANEKIKQCIDWIEFNFQTIINDECVKAIIQIFQLCTDYSDTQSDTDDSYLNQMVGQLISIVKEQRVINDEDTLHMDLMKHLKASFESQALGYVQKNPLLETIKELYSEDFDFIKKCIKQMDSVFQSHMNEDEIGYLTLYFKRSFEKAESIQETRVMVVCNSGRSASKLLATRLLNNLPNLHIVAMSSLFGLQSNSKNLENVDLVISTIPLPGISKPHLVVSPFLQKNEIDKVKEMIWLNSTRHSNLEKTKSSEEINDAILHQDQMMFESYLAEKAMEQSAIGEQYANIIVDLFELIRQLYPTGIDISKYNNVTGIFAHVVMSVSRWKKKDFIRASDYEDIVERNEKEYRYILDFLRRTGKRLDVFIPDIEVVAILRYYVF